MDRVRHFLDDVKRRGLARGNFLGLLNVMIGRRIALSDGTPVSGGMNYRELAAHLKRVRWGREAADEVGIDRTTLPPRDRERYWYQVIVLARVDSQGATAAGDALTVALRAAGYDIGPAPGSPGPTE
jgi:hypothetical protein